MRVALVLLAVALAAAGCFEPEGDPRVNEGEPNTGPAFVQDLLAASECEGFNFATLYGPGLNPAPTPDGWESDDEDGSAIEFTFWSCDSVGLGALERPASFLWINSNHVKFPAGCADEERPGLKLVIQVLVDDADVARELSAIGLPAEKATFEPTSSPAGTSWMWTTEEGQSNLDLAANGLYTTTTPNQRWLWAHGNSTTRMDLDEKDDSDPLSAAISGTLAGPYGAVAEDRVATFGAILENAGFTAELHSSPEGCQ